MEFVKSLHARASFFAAFKIICLFDLGRSCLFKRFIMADNGTECLVEHGRVHVEPHAMEPDLMPMPFAMFFDPSPGLAMLVCGWTA